EPVRLADISSPNSGGQTINGVIRYGKNFLWLLERSRYHDRAENLFLHDLHLRLHIDQHGRLDEISRVADFLPATQGSSAFRDAGVKVAANAVQLFIGNQWAHFRRRIQARSDFDFLRMLRNSFRDLIEDALLHIKPRSGATALSMVEKDRAGSS